MEEGILPAKQSPSYYAARLNPRFASGPAARPSLEMVPVAPCDAAMPQSPSAVACKEQVARGLPSGGLRGSLGISLSLPWGRLQQAPSQGGFAHPENPHCQFWGGGSAEMRGGVSCVALGILLLLGLGRGHHGCARCGKMLPRGLFPRRLPFPAFPAGAGFQKPGF